MLWLSDEFDRDTYVAPKGGVEMRRNVTLLLLAVVGLAACSSPAHAQLFGERTVGGPSLSRRPSPGQTGDRSRQFPTGSSQSSRSRTTLASGAERPTFESVGEMVDENARYVRGNRDAADFVGSDLGDVQDFVGMQQTGVEAELRSAIDELIIEETPDVNLLTQPVIPPRMLLNPPRMQVGFDFTPRPADIVSSQLTRRVGSKLSSDASNRIEVWVEDGVAILRGEVVSERDRKLAGILVGFEPGVARVRNEIRLASATPANVDHPLLLLSPHPLLPPPPEPLP